MYVLVKLYSKYLSFEVSVPTEDLMSSIFKNSKIISRNHQSEIRQVSSVEKKLKDQMSPTDLKKIIKIQALFRKRDTQKKYKILLKRYKFRKNVIMELVKTEESYVKSLSVVVTKVINPAREKKYLNEEEMRLLFLNIESIKKFNEGFSKLLNDNLGNFDHQKTLIAQNLDKQIPGFRLYNDYCGKFEDSTSFLRKIKESKHIFNVEFLKNKEETDELENLNLESLLVKPVQRLPKYVLLFRDLLKHTDQDHKDYKNIEKVLEFFKSINEENNKKMDLYVRQFRMLELQKNFPNPNIEILCPNREYLGEETMGLIMENSSLALPLNHFAKALQPVS